MAAPTRPSLRFSSRNQNPSLDDVPRLSTAGQLPGTRAPRGKRTRDSSPGSLSNASVKKSKASSTDNTPPKVVERIEIRDSLPIRDKGGTSKHAVTQVGKARKQNPPQHHQHPPEDGNDPAASNARAFLSNGSLAVNADVATATTCDPPQSDKRSLRSHDGGSRSKSELAMYFPNYDEIVSIEPKEPDFLTPETHIYITDETSKQAKDASSDITNGTHKRKASSMSQKLILNGPMQPLQLPENTFTTLNNATRLDLFSLDKTTRHLIDPLPDSLYEKAHRRAERQEKQLRNIEKERAMHEKVQLERLLEGLKGHDWLRVMGISGITETEKKLYEPKRDYFIREVRVLLVKFRKWKEEEKRRKVEKDESMADEDEEQSGGEEHEAAEGAEDEEKDPVDEETTRDLYTYTTMHPKFGDPAALQLHHEATLATRKSTQTRPKTHELPRPKQPNQYTKRPPAPTSKAPAAPLLSSSSEHDEKPFTSFYSKPYLRDAAIGKHRRTGRTRFAFGQPLPEIREGEFDLGEGILTEERVRASERKRRASKRAKEAEEGMK